jgi:hypothetical protein
VTGDFARAKVLNCFRPETTPPTSVGFSGNIVEFFIKGVYRGTGT